MSDPQPPGPARPRVKAPRTDRTLSELVNAAVRQTLAEDAENSAALAERAHEVASSPRSRVSPPIPAHPFGEALCQPSR